MESNSQLRTPDLFVVDSDFYCWAILTLAKKFALQKFLFVREYAPLL